MWGSINTFQKSRVHSVKDWNHLVTLGPMCGCVVPTFLDPTVPVTIYLYIVYKCFFRPKIPTSTRQIPGPSSPQKRRPRGAMPRSIKTNDKRPRPVPNPRPPHRYPHPRAHPLKVDVGDGTALRIGGWFSGGEKDWECCEMCWTLPGCWESAS